MAKLSKQTLQRLAVLRALLLWRRGPYGPLRVHKTLFFAERGLESQRFFTFQRWHKGQYSPEVTDSLNLLQTAGQIASVYDGPSERITVVANKRLVGATTALFAQYFPAWTAAIVKAHRDLGYARNAEVLSKAHDDSSYTESQHGDVLSSGDLAELVELPGVPSEGVKFLADSVDDTLRKELVKRLKEAASRPIRDMDWRADFFPEESCSK